MDASSQLSVAQTKRLIAVISLLDRLAADEQARLGYTPLHETLKQGVRTLLRTLFLSAHRINEGSGGDSRRETQALAGKARRASSPKPKKSLASKYRKPLHTIPVLPTPLA